MLELGGWAGGGGVGTWLLMSHASFGRMQQVALRVRCEYLLFGESVLPPPPKSILSSPQTSISVKYGFFSLEGAVVHWYMLVFFLLRLMLRPKK